MKKLLLASLFALGTSAYFIEASALRTAQKLIHFKYFPIRAASTLVKIRSFSEIEKRFHPYDRQSGNPHDATLQTINRIEKQIEKDG